MWNYVFSLTFGKLCSIYLTVPWVTDPVVDSVFTLPRNLDKNKRNSSLTFTNQSRVLIQPLRRGLFKTLWKKEKILVTSIFSFSHNVFNSFQSKIQF